MSNLERAVTREGSGIFRLSWGDGELRVEARAEDLGTTSTPIPALCQGEGKVAFNAAYLLEYLKGKEGTVTLSAGGEKQPGLFSHRGTPNLAIMPMFVQWEGEQGSTSPPAPEPPQAAPETPSASAEPGKARSRRKKANKKAGK